MNEVRARGVRVIARSLLLLLTGLCFWVPSARAQTEMGSRQNEIPSLKPAPDLSTFIGRSIERIELVTSGKRWGPTQALAHVRVGQAFTPELARLAMQELVETGFYADVACEASEGTGGIVLTLKVLPRRLIAQVRALGSELPEEELIEALGLKEAEWITHLDAALVRRKVERYYARRGYIKAKARVELVDTDEPLEVVVLIHIEAGNPSILKQRRFVIAPPVSAELKRLLDDYDVELGERVDEDRFTQADNKLAQQLKQHGFYDARVQHRLRRQRELEVRVDPGVQIEVRFEGNRSFDELELTGALALTEDGDRSEAALSSRLVDYYQARGFLDVQVRVEPRKDVQRGKLQQLFIIQEMPRVSIVRRRYPCLSGTRSPEQLGEEIDSFLGAALPSGGIFVAPEPTVLNRATGNPGVHRTRPRMLTLDPYSTYSRDTYEKAINHIQELYRSEGYLSAKVGPVTLVRRRCDPRSAPGECLPLGPVPAPSCDGKLRPNEKPATSCVPDPARGLYCETSATLDVPVQLGPRTTLYDLAFEGNRAFVEDQLRETSALVLGEAASYVELENAQRRLSSAYAEQGYAFAAVEADFDLSTDRTRARAHFVISEREQVRIKNIVVEGAERTRQELILDRAVFRPNDIYKRGDARRTEELLATLGTFSSVSVALQDPEVPAREKTVVITVRERPSQYLEVQPGVSTGEGVRMALEYGHRNVNGAAVQFRVRVQLGYLPDFLILDAQVQRKYQELALSQRLERSNSIGVEFPEIGLGPLYRFSIEGVDVRDNSRDYGITKDAALVTLTHRPDNEFTASLRGSLELNNAEVFGDYEKGALARYITRYEGGGSNIQLGRRLFAVPQGQSLAIAQRVGFSWDRRDNPFGATRGTFFSLTAEHVNAVSLEEKEPDPPSHFMHYTSRLAGYLRLSNGGLALATSLTVGLNQQLRSASQTYPDRFFFMGGADSLRGFLQASLIPEDVAQSILNPDAEGALTLNEVTIRGGDFMLNPRMELRIPLGSIWQTAVFVDAGNVWLSAKDVDPFNLRYAAGSGLRANTPVGPLALDYGINLQRRSWEDFGAFHFSIGLF